MRGLFLGLVFLGSFALPCEAKVVKGKAPAKLQAKKAVPATAESVKRALASAGRKPAMIGDPNRAVEIRGQSRTLSMMLVLKNGKESINFIKIRKDYAPEIGSTQY